MDAFPKVPQPEGAVLAACDNEALSGMTGGAGQLHVVTGQTVQQNLTSHVPKVSGSIPRSGDNLIGSNESFRTLIIKICMIFVQL